MKAVLQSLKNGKLYVDEVPPPALKPGGLNVRVQRSLISLGTEKAIISLAKKGPIGKARDRPDLARKVINKAKQDGYLNTYKVVKNLIGSPIPLGYSCAGEVIEVGSEATSFRVGDRVACAGLNYANHAEINYVPRNLAVKMPDELSYDHASFVTVGAIAMQGIRLANIELGEKVVVLGLGIVGQLAAQLARASGARVLVNDLSQQKIELATKLGAEQAVENQGALGEIVMEFTDGAGADAVIICASTKSSALIHLAAEVTRLKGRIVVIGDIGMDIDRRDLYVKEIRLEVSRSYGPGRYDPNYEEHGIDYPLAYVRWTEGRNMSAFLNLVARQDVRVEQLITHRFKIADAESAYKLVTGPEGQSAVAVMLEYNDDVHKGTLVNVFSGRTAQAENQVALGVIGAGQFAKGVLLPAFASLKSVRFTGFCTSSGITSKHVAKTYAARFCTSNPSEVINDKVVNTVLVLTRHDRHADLIMEALRAKKAVFVEKPLAMTPTSLSDVCSVLQNLSNPRLMVGYNRRFSPLSQKCKAFFADRNAPVVITYRVNAGPIPADSWVADVKESGGRIIGEVCHFIDMLCYLTDALPKRIFAEEIRVGSQPRRDCLVINVRMSDESLGVIHYQNNGDSSVSKEYFEMHGDGRSAILDNYRKLSLHRGNRRRQTRLLNQAKGHNEEVTAFVNALVNGKAMPIDLETLIAVTQTTFLIHESLEVGAPVDYRPVTSAEPKPNLTLKDDQNE